MGDILIIVCSLKIKYYFEYMESTNNIKTNQINGEIIQTGIGDILLAMALVKNNLIKKPIYFNLAIYNKNHLNLDDPENHLRFKMKLIKQLDDDNEIIFYDDPNIKYTNWNNFLKQLKKFDILKNYFTFENKYTNEYIVFHTKCRFTAKFNYTDFKNKLKLFFKNYKTNYKIILLGEQTFNTNNYSPFKIFGITTIYNELLELKENNEVIDLTIPEIYNSFDFDKYTKDLSIIYYAKHNIVVGHGGQFVNCIFFGNSSVVYTLPELLCGLDINNLKNNNIHCHFDIENFKKYLKTL